MQVLHQNYSPPPLALPSQFILALKNTLQGFFPASQMDDRWSSNKTKCGNWPCYAGGKLGTGEKSLLIRLASVQIFHPLVVTLCIYSSTMYMQNSCMQQAKPKGDTALLFLLPLSPNTFIFSHRSHHLTSVPPFLSEASQNLTWPAVRMR